MKSWSIRHFLSWPIRVHLLLLVMLLTLPAVGIIVKSGLNEREKALAEAARQTSQLAYSVATVQQDVVDATEQLMSTLALLPQLRHHNKPAMDTILAGLLRENTQYANIYVADASGILWASAVPHKQQVSHSEMRYFRNALSCRCFSSGENATGKITGRRVMHFGFPVKDASGAVTNVIGAALDLSQTIHLLGQAALPERSTLTLLDHKGTVLSRTIDSRFIGSQDKDSLFRSIQAGGKEGTFKAYGLDGTYRLFAFQKLYLRGENTPYLYIRTGIPTAAVLEKANRVMLRNLLALAPFPFAALILAWLIGKKAIIDRISALQAASQRLAGGDLDARVSEAVTGGELGRLGTAFDEMAENIARRDWSLRCSEERLRVILETSPAGIIMVNADLETVSFSNGLMAHMCGREAADLIGTSFMACLHPEERVPLKSHLRRLAAGEMDQVKFECRYLHGCGDEYWASLSAKSLTDAEGRCQGLVIAMHDITEQKRTETEIYNLNMDLQQRAAELAVANQDLEAFGYSLSHDLKAPLSVICCAAEGLEDIYGEQLDETALLFVQNIGISAERINGLIDAMALLSRISRNEIQQLEVDLSAMAAEILQRLHIEEESRRVETVIEPGITVKGDPSLLRAALENLLGNAWKYTRNKPVTRIHFARAAENGRILFIRDNGAGFDMKDAGKLFQPFQRLHDNREFEGSGIGLATVQRIIQRHGGRLWGEGEAGLGATFYFSLDQG